MLFEGTRGCLGVRVSGADGKTFLDVRLTARVAFLGALDRAFKYAVPLGGGGGFQFQVG